MSIITIDHKSSKHTHTHTHTLISSLICIFASQYIFFSTRRHIHITIFFFSTPRKYSYNNNISLARRKYSHNNISHAHKQYSHNNIFPTCRQHSHDNNSSLAHKQYSYNNIHHVISNTNITIFVILRGNSFMIHNNTKYI